MAGFDRYSNVLRLFSADQSSLTVAQMAKAVRLPTSTVYRTVRELVAAGFLESAAGSYFRLGPTFIEYNRTINQTDPLILSGDEHLQQLADVLPQPGATVLARLYGNQVMCVADARSPSFRHDTSFQRGVPMPITRGATSRAILAQVRGKRLDRLLLSTELESGVSRQGFKQELKQIRRARLSVTRNEVDQGLVGYAVPVSNRSLGIEASVSCIFSDIDHSPDWATEIAEILWSSAKRMEDDMQHAFERIAGNSKPPS